LSASLLEEEETQIAGLATIMDHAGVTMKQTSLFSVTDIVDFANVMKNAVGRHKQSILVNLPSFAGFLLDVARNSLNDKFKKRIVLAKDIDDLKNYMNPAILPKELGGELPQSEHMARFQEYFRGIRPRMDEIHAKVIDWARVPDINNMKPEAVGSFRKLEID